MDAIGLQLERLLGGTVAPDGNVIFENILSSFGPVSYEPITGVITINKTGRYLVNWWVVTQSSSGLIGISFAIVTSQGDEFLGGSPIKTAEFSGVALIQVDAAPITLRLASRTVNNVTYSPLLTSKAFLVLGEVPEETGITGTTGATGDTGPTGTAG
ncbi:hypothetical protein ALO_16202, partial [Acetonema longum DSM 6540]